MAHLTILSTVTANTDMPVKLREQPGTRHYDLSARVSRTKTLDGGVVITHNGVVHGDRTLRVVSALQESDTLKLRTVFEEETEVTLSCAAGFFRGALESLTSDEGQIDMSFLVKEKLA